MHMENLSLQFGYDAGKLTGNKGILSGHLKGCGIHKTIKRNSEVHFNSSTKLGFGKKPKGNIMKITIKL